MVLNWGTFFQLQIMMFSSKHPAPLRVFFRLLFVKKLNELPPLKFICLYCNDGKVLCITYLNQTFYIFIDKESQLQRSLPIERRNGFFYKPEKSASIFPKLLLVVSRSFLLTSQKAYPQLKKVLCSNLKKSRVQSLSLLHGKIYRWTTFKVC